MEAKDCKHPYVIFTDQKRKNFSSKCETCTLEFAFGLKYFPDYVVKQFYECLGCGMPYLLHPFYDANKKCVKCEGILMLR